MLSRGTADRAAALSGCAELPQPSQSLTDRFSIRLEQPPACGVRVEVDGIAGSDVDLRCSSDLDEQILTIQELAGEDLLIAQTLAMAYLGLEIPVRCRCQMPVFRPQSCGEVLAFSLK